MSISATTDRESQILKRFRADNPDLFRKSDLHLAVHLATVFTLLALGTYAILAVPYVWLKILIGPVNAFLLFSLCNVTIHHHHTHHNAASSDFFKRLLTGLNLVLVPDFGRHLKRYRRAHMNHHVHPMEETDVDHLYGLMHYQKMSRNVWTKLWYYVEMTLVGAHAPAQKDESYINGNPPTEWNLEAYERVKRVEVRKGIRNSLIAWAVFFVVLWFFPPLAWAWIYPMILVKNWGNFLGQFQHFDERLLDDERSRHNRTLTFRVPGWLNYLAGGEISGHFLHHLYPDMPYYHVERARRRLLKQPDLIDLAVNY